MWIAKLQIIKLIFNDLYKLIITYPTSGILKSLDH